MMGRKALWTLVGLCASACASNGNALPPGSNGGGGGGGSSSGSGGSGSGGERDANTAGDLKDDAATSTGGSGGAGGDAAPDVGGADVGSADIGGACPPGTLLCDDFESYGTPAELMAAWKPSATAATLTVDATKAWKGTRSLHIKAAAGTPSAVIVRDGAPLFPIAGNVMFGRVMLWLTATPGGNYHWNSIQAAGTIPGSMLWGKYGWGGQFGKVLAGYTVRTTPAGSATTDCSKPSAMAIPAQRWVCVEWEFDGNKNEMHLWFDGALLADADIVGMGNRCVNQGDLGKPWAGPIFSNQTLGWQQYQASSGALELWMDDLAVGKDRLGCPALP
ncbi:MAG: hypothetical protein QOI66_3768 [Myxococcales bacterium]|nr:hypothetical protein [Myxococcales bacterium]